ncbi:MAG: sigma-70 family RNA polymerase sigma factor [Planctomycetales bacterium]|nr:sigma-70 family RNA polymerase sigma factor [Planctomycetales bacterium]MCA9166570.1 sigma-70 family RNA polymerase sigma factor [Planctomycetales bacterium]
MSRPMSDSDLTKRLLDRIAQGDRTAIDPLLDRQREYLNRMLAVRMEPALQRRVDPSDIVQETMMVAAGRLDDFLERRPTTFRLWLRHKAIERLVEHRRKHFAQKRTVQREVSLQDASSAIARSLLSARPSKLLIEQEIRQQIHDVMLTLSSLDQEILLLRHAEELSNQEIATLLGLDFKTTSKRYGRALLRLSEKLAQAGLTQ